MDSNSRFPELPELAVDLTHLLDQIPCGRVCTYGDLARALGDTEARAARWVGEMLAHCPHLNSDEPCHCHRVVRQDGDIGLYAEGPEAKQTRLIAEGVPVKEGRVNLGTARWTDFRTTFPLLQLRQLQSAWQSQIRLTEHLPDVRRWGAVDVAYPHPHLARGAFVVLDPASMQVTWSSTLEMPCQFPYIPGYLSFRELPVLLKLWETVLRANQQPDVVFVDGNGILHQRGIGLASALGVLLNVPTVGVGKSLLCGQVDLRDMAPCDPRPIHFQGSLVGMALKSQEDSRPIYISPGHLTTVSQAAGWALDTLRDHRIPEPVYQADRLTKAASSG